MPFEERLLRDIRKRMQEIAPALKEIPKLEKADKALRKLK